MLAELKARFKTTPLTALKPSSNKRSRNSDKS